jgi:LPXTG-site transpeptidase (sortase) family protein
MPTRRRSPLVVSLAAAIVLFGVVATGVSFAALSGSRVIGTVRTEPRSYADVVAQGKHLFAVPPFGKHHVVVGENPIRIKIPALKLDSPIIQTLLVGNTWQVADWAVGDMVGSPNPGTCTLWSGTHDCTTALSAHDDIEGEIFKRNNDLKTGDKIIVYTRKSVFVYRVNAKYTVTPYDSSNLFSATKSVALVSCTPYWQDDYRLIVSAILVKDHPRHI